MHVYWQNAHSFNPSNKVWLSNSKKKSVVAIWVLIISVRSLTNAHSLLFIWINSLWPLFWDSKSASKYLFFLFYTIQARLIFPLCFFDYWHALIQTNLPIYDPIQRIKDAVAVANICPIDFSCFLFVKLNRRTNEQLISLESNKFAHLFRLFSLLSSLSYARLYTFLSRIFWDKKTSRCLFSSFSFFNFAPSVPILSLSSLPHVLSKSRQTASWSDLFTQSLLHWLIATQEQINWVQTHVFSTFIASFTISSLFLFQHLRISTILFLVVSSFPSTTIICCSSLFSIFAFALDRCNCKRNCFCKHVHKIDRIRVSLFDFSFSFERKSYLLI